jgi:hypothetical protein
MQIIQPKPSPDRAGGFLLPADQRKDDRMDQKKRNEEFIRRIEKLTEWEKMRILLFIEWMILRRRIRNIPVNWIRWMGGIKP